MERLISMMCLSLGLLNVCSMGAPIQQAESIWHLTSVIDEDGQAGVRAANAKDKAWRFDVNYSRDSVRGSFRIKHTYLGPTDKSFKIPHVSGASTTTDTTWTSPPARVAAGTDIALKVTGSATRRTHAWPNPYVGLIAQVVSKNAKGEYVSQLKTFRNKKRQDMMMVGSGSGFKPFNETVVAALSKGGRVGDTLGIKVSVSNGNARSATVYVYTWGPVPAVLPVIKDY
jgi:hypothetical protein